CHPHAAALCLPQGPLEPRFRLRLGARGDLHRHARPRRRPLSQARAEGDRVMTRRPGLLRRLLTTDLPVLLIVAFALGPYVWMFLTSVTPQDHLARTGVTLDPASWVLANYERLFRRTSFLGNLGHSLIVASGTVVLGLVLSIGAAYAFSRFRFPGRRLLMTQFLVINMFPVVLLILPLFVLMRRIGLLDTHAA